MQANTNNEYLEEKTNRTILYREIVADMFKQNDNHRYD